MKQISQNFRAARGSLWRRYLPVGLALSLGVALSMGMFVLVRGWEHDRLQASFERRVSDFDSALERTIMAGEEVLSSISDVYATEGRLMDRNVFNGLAIRAMGRHPEIEALGWVPRVLPSQRGEYEEAARAQGFPNFRFTETDMRGDLTEAGMREEHYPIFYLSQSKAEVASFGFDLASTPARLEAMHYSRDEGIGVATEKVNLVEEAGQEAGFLYFHPVYRSGLPHGTLQDRRENLFGFMMAIFHTGDMLKQSFQGLGAEEVELHLYDMTAPVGKRLLYVLAPSREQTVAAYIMGEVDPYETPKALGKVYWTTPLEVGSREWALLFYPTQGYLANQDHWQSWGALVLGLLLTVVSNLYILAALRRTAGVERLVALRTRELRQESMARSLILSTASHELRTPLTSIIGYVDRLLGRRDAVGPLTERQERYLGNVQEESGRLKMLIDNLLDVSLMETGRLELTLTDLKVRPEIDHAIQCVRNQFRDKEIHAELNIPEDLGPLKADQGRLSQIIINLLSNAYKYSPQGGTVTINATESDGVVQIDFVDTGKGISKSDQALLFTKFFRVDNTLTHKEPGTGLGLFVTKQLVEAQGGSIWVTSEEGRGSSFSLILPSAAAPARIGTPTRLTQTLES